MELVAVSTTFQGEGKKTKSLRGKLQQHRLAYYAHTHTDIHLHALEGGKKNKGEQTGCHSPFILAVTPVRCRDHRPWQISMVLDLQVLDLALCIVGLPSKDSFLLNDSSSMSSREKQQPFFSQHYPHFLLMKAAQRGHLKALLQPSAPDLA